MAHPSVLALFVAALLLPQPLLPGSSSPVAKKTVAVLSFDNNSGKDDYDPLGKGIAAMMITDLSSVQSVQVVERERMQDLVNEMQMQQSKFFDQKTAVQLGKMVGAEYVVTGALMALDPRIRIDTRVIRVSTGEIVKTARVTGDQKKFFDLQQKLSKELLDGLDVALSPEEAEKLQKQQEAERIDDLQVQLEYSEALDLFDRKMYFEAAEKMGDVVRKAPDSVLARNAYKMMQDRAKTTAKKKTTDKLKGWLKGKIDG
ncbi:MAG TPA: FlgO family outer membrane protein [Longimicrobiales bacterium]